MPCIGKSDCRLHRLRVTNFTNENNVRSLSHCTLQRGMEGVCVKTNFPLVDDRLFMWMNVFDWVFDRDDMARCRSIAMIDHCGKRSRLSRAGCADDQDQSSFRHDDVFKDRWKSKLFERWDL